MKSITFLWFIGLIFIFSCGKNRPISVLVVNPIEANRENETIEVDLSSVFQNLSGTSIEKIQVTDKDGKLLASQKIDTNNDEMFDLLIFQTDLRPREEKTFYLKQKGEVSFPAKTFARFVPEREDDFAWENDRIAYRMYSKKLAAKENVDSGVDVWVKSVDQLVIDKWYASEDYHEDHGEGLDFYKVGPSRGCGGLAIFDGNKLVGTGGFAGYQVIVNGPIRSQFELEYDPVEIEGKFYTERRKISIDAGWNLYKTESRIESKENFQVAVGIKIHPEQGNGFVVTNKAKGFISFWEPATAGNGELGTAIVLKADQVRAMQEIEGHHVVIADVKAGETFCFYSGAGWSKSKHFPDHQSWNEYVENKALCMNNPVNVIIKK